MELNSMLPIIAIVISVLSFILAIIAVIMARNASNKSSHNRIEDISQSVFDQKFYFSIDRKLRGVVREELSNNQMVKDNQERLDFANSVIKEEKGIPESQKTETVSEVTVSEKPAKEVVASPIVIYTGSYATGSFRHISTAPDDKNVFTIRVDSKDASEGTLDIDINAYNKVAQTPDYLERACSWSGSGSMVIVKKTGVVVKENGAWVVKDPIIAEFN